MPTVEGREGRLPEGARHLVGVAAVGAAHGPVQPVDGQVRSAAHALATERELGAPTGR